MLFSEFSAGALHILAAGGGDHTHGVIMTLATALFFGGLLTILARKLAMPAIILLLAGGVILGPEVTGLIQPDEYLAEVLQAIVALSIGIILFEGGLTLDLRAYRKTSRMIHRLLSIGVLITWIGTAGLVWLLFRFDFAYCMLAGSLVIVTGPTVVAPLLKRIRLKWNLHNILHWEGVMIDPIGVFIAVLSFELVVEAMGGAAWMNFVFRFIVGLLIGVVGGHAMWLAIRSKFVHEEQLNLFAISGAVLIYGMAEAFISEGGLLSVTVAGLYLGWRKPVEIEAIKEFKSTLTEVLIGLLFILLSARLDLDQFREFGWKGFLLVLGVMFVVRPIAITLCSIGSGLKWREVAFLSWVAPRGIVAASMSSLFVLALQSSETNTFEAPAFLESFVFATIVMTIVIQGFTAAPIALALKLQNPKPEGWGIVGAHELGRRVAKYIEEEAGLPVVLVDVNRPNLIAAKEAGFTAFYADAREVKALEGIKEFQAIGHVLALTDNEDLNELICRRWATSLGQGSVYFWTAGKGEQEAREASAGQVVWSGVPKPSFICGELEHHEAQLVVTHTVEEDRPDGIIPLMAVRNKKIVLDPQVEKSASSFLCLRREVDYLLGALHPELVMELDCKDKQTLLEMMLKRIDQIASLGDTDRILYEIVEREKHLPTALGHGIAIPHDRVASLEHPVCAIARLKQPLTFSDAENAEPVNMVFLLLSPSENPEMHLAVLGEIARLIADEELRDSLFAAKDNAELLERIRRHRVMVMMNRTEGG